MFHVAILCVEVAGCVCMLWCVLFCWGVSVGLLAVALCVCVGLFCSVGWWFVSFMGWCGVVLIVILWCGVLPCFGFASCVAFLLFGCCFCVVWFGVGLSCIILMVVCVSSVCAMYCLACRNSLFWFVGVLYSSQVNVCGCGCVRYMYAVISRRTPPSVWLFDMLWCVCFHLSLWLS